ncbi:MULTISPECIES: glycosyltransferase family 2 protein [unclassified Methanosarcina]|uniref:glycosyltransferase family 2 protein n=1 Tax=unclassified Methanosarcina TaxID=2644672 RepID=UPI00062143B6|nr:MULTISPECIES: glycosyltransferase family 2 protein [unclassified Methanosarcina]KKG09447.1 dolichyl-phosphate mannose synthase [Methanosarcina sp. 2.H.A.1B.4]KKH48327.1 dolichyl-phosphate mannose synthase [Methanosarcina sp. 1.H.A.2.2]
MNSELLLSKSSQCITQEDTSFARETVPQKITVILPAFNEEISIGSVVLLARQYADRVIVVDDGSSDRTAEIAEKVGAEVIVHSLNSGKGMALKTGFEAAEGSDVIVTMDSDGQHNPSDIPKLVSPILEDVADMVNGSRYLNGNRKNTPSYRRVGQTILDKATNMNSGIQVTDSQSGFRAFAGHTKDIFRFNSKGMAIESEMLSDAGKAGLRIKEVEIGVRYDVGRSTENPIRHGLMVLLKILTDMEFNRPLYYFTIPGFVLGTSGLYMGLSFLQTFYLGGNLHFGPTILMILLTLVGTFMVFTGIMLHSIAGILRESIKS